jgi:hypothetical protein
MLVLMGIEKEEEIMMNGSGGLVLDGRVLVGEPHGQLPSSSWPTWSSYSCQDSTVNPIFAFMRTIMELSRENGFWPVTFDEVC